MRRLIVALFPLLLCGATWYAAPNGTAAGDGSLKAPWDLQTALSHPLAAGDVVQLRGGTYVGKFRSPASGLTVQPYPGEEPRLDGNYTTALASPVTDSQTTLPLKSAFRVTEGQVVIVEAESMQVAASSSGTSMAVNRPWNGTVAAPHTSGATVILVGTVLEVTGAGSTYQGLEIMHSGPNRVSSQPGSDPLDIDSGECITDRGPGNRFINNVLHDCRENGLGAWEQAIGGHYYGNVIFNNGWQGPDRKHGHGIYTQNRTSNKYFTQNITTLPFYYNVQQYGSDQSALNNYYWIKHIFLSGPSLFGGGAPLNNLNLSEAVSIKAPIQVGYGNPDNNGILLANSYLTSGVSFSLSKNVRATGNVIWNDGGPDNVNVVLRLDATPPNVPSDYAFDGNAYFRSNANFPYHQFGVTPDPSPAPCGYFWWNVSAQGYGYCGPSGNSWQGLGYDVSGSYTPSPPTGTKVFLWPNQHDATRATLVIYNWSQAASIGVDISSLGWPSGTVIRARNAQDYYGDTFQVTYKAVPISVPMTGHTVAKPIGMSAALQPTSFPTAGVFLLEQAGLAAVPQLPAPSIIPAGGVFRKQVVVSITAAQGAIRYSLDGSMPGPSSILYSGSVRLKTSTELRAVAIDGAKHSEVVTVMFVKR